jgi:hypothetical protein
MRQQEPTTHQHGWRLIEAKRALVPEWVLRVLPRAWQLRMPLRRMLFVKVTEP